MLNHIVIIGRLTADPELRTTQSGIHVASFRIAVERDYAAQGGEKTTDFFDVTAWRSTSDFVSKYFTKGRAIAIDGRLQTKSWTDRDGNKRTGVEIVAENCYFADSRRDNTAQQGGAYAAA